MHVPDRLTFLAKQFWKKHRRHLLIADYQEAGFALCRRAWSDYREAPNDNLSAKWLEHYVRLAKLYGLLPKTSNTNTTVEPTKDDFVTFLEASDGW